MEIGESENPVCLELPEILIEALQTDVVPEIVESCRLAGDAHDSDPDFNDNYTLGTFSWRNLFNRLSRKLSKKRWTVRSSENDLRLAYRELENPIELRVHRCDEDTRVPTGGKRAKLVACGQQFLSPAIEREIAKKFQLVIAYDLDSIQGLGRITIEKLIGMSPKEMLSLTVTVLYQAERISFVDDTVVADPEHVATPGVVKAPVPERIADPEASLDSSKDTSASKIEMTGEDG